MCGARAARRSTDLGVGGDFNTYTVDASGGSSKGDGHDEGVGKCDSYNERGTDLGDGGGNSDYTFDEGGGDSKGDGYDDGIGKGYSYKKGGGYNLRDDCGEGEGNVYRYNVRGGDIEGDGYDVGVGNSRDYNEGGGCGYGETGGAEGCGFLEGRKNEGESGDSELEKSAVGANGSEDGGGEQQSGGDELYEDAGGARPLRFARWAECVRWGECAQGETAISALGVGVENGLGSSSPSLRWRCDGAWLAPPSPRALEILAAASRPTRSRCGGSWPPRCAVVNRPKTPSNSARGSA